MLQSGINIGNPKALVATSMGMLKDGAAAVSGYTGLVADINSSQMSSNNHRCVYVFTGTTVTSCTDSSACGNAKPNASCK